MAKLAFHRAEYAAWLHDVVVALNQRLTVDIQAVAAKVGEAYLEHGEQCELDTGKPPFDWSRQ